MKKKLTENEIDRMVISQADDDSAWEKATLVRRTKHTSLSISPYLAMWAAFLAKLHRKANMEE